MRVLIIIIIIIIIIIRHEFCLDRLVLARLIVFSKVLQVIIVHLVYNAALFWHPVVHSCYMS